MNINHLFSIGDLFVVMAHLQEMFAKSMRGIHERFDSMEKAIQALTEQQKATEKKIEEIMTSKVLKSKVFCEMNFRKCYIRTTHSHCIVMYQHNSDLQI